MNIEIGAYEAKTKLPALLRGVQAGIQYTITSRGRPVADLVPAATTRDNNQANAVEQMRQLMLSASSGKRINLKELISEGSA